MRAAAGVATVLLLAACSSPEPSAEPSAPSSASPPAAPSLHLALGDSVAAGVGAEPERGYVPLLTARLAQACDCDVELRDLSVGGATTATLLRDQLPAAQDVLRSGADVRVVTVTIGGNDVFGPVVVACAQAPASPGCSEAVQAALRTADTGVRQALQALREAGPAVPVAVMTYYDPVPACDLSALAPLSARVLEGQGDQPGLNDVLRAAATDAGALVVETADRLAAGDLVGGRDCLHPGPSGHERIAEAFAEVLAG